MLELLRPLDRRAARVTMAQRMCVMRLIKTQYIIVSFQIP